MIVSDQRMPKMTGVEFLREVKRRYPDTVRIVLSGYTDLQSVTAAINEGAIYKFLTKPWDDELLRADVREAFGIYELRWENRRLARELKEANEALARFNLELEKRVEEKARHLQLNAASLKLSQELLNLLPVAVIGIDNDGMIVFANQLAHRLLDDSPSLLERPLQAILPQVAAALRHADDGWLAQPILLADACWARVSVQSLGQAPQTRGRLITLVMNEEA